MSILNKFNEKELSRRDFLKYVFGFFAFFSLGGMLGGFFSKNTENEKINPGYGSGGYGV